MTYTFEIDPIGAVLEFFSLFEDPSSGSRSSWEKNNYNPASRGPRPSLNSGGTIWIGPAVSRSHIENTLRVGREKDALRSSLNRVFRLLDSNHLIEPMVGDDNPNTSYRTLSALGRELLAEDSFHEFIEGPFEIVNRWSPSVASIYNESASGIGTAFLVNSQTLVTACHVVEELGVDGLVIEFHGGIKMSVESVTVPKDRMLDVAIIRLTHPVDRRAMRWGRLPQRLEEVVVFGYPPIPLSTEAALVTARGEVSALPNLYAPKTEVVVVSCLLRGGFSGGPVLNRRGQVVGIVSKNLFKQIRGDEQLNEGLGFAAAFPARWAQAALASTIDVEILK